jgi:NAD(P)-dependent dehydrogenase (short-subunit alcohol dehydrogenase family)
MSSAQKAILVSISSDIGFDMAKRWLAYGWSIYGTYRTYTNRLEELSNQGAILKYCDLSDIASIEHCCQELKIACPEWDTLVLCPGVTTPIGPFQTTNFGEWADSININFTHQLQIIHALLQFRNRNHALGPCMLTFAGGGTNNATLNYSAYTVSKIAFIKMIELLDAEIPDMRFAIIGPGWVKTKIHQSTLDAGEALASANFQKTKDKLDSNELTPMETVLDCCDWIIESPREVIGGRNFSVVFDKWGTDELAQILIENNDYYKLRRFGNDYK